MSDELNNSLRSAILKALEGVTPTQQDMSIMVKLTPLEVFNMVKMGAEYWARAKENDTHLTMEEVCKHHAEFSLGILAATDPDRFIHNS